MNPKSRLTAIKALGLIAFAVLTAVASLGTSSAMAENTQLCQTDTEPCGSPVTSVHEVSVGKGKLLTSLGTVECNVLFSSTSVGASGAPQIIKGNFTYTNCELGGASCSATEENGPAELKVLKEGHENASVTGEGLVHLTCGALINCRYNGANLKGAATGSLLSTQANGEVVLTGQEAAKEAGSGFICTKSAKLDITTTPLSATYIHSGGGLSSTPTSISTSLKGGGKEGAEITVSEGSKVKDTATLSGENASTAGGTLTYKIFKDKECKELVSEAGKVTVKEGKVPDSEEKELEAGKEYFWQAEYGGDEMNKASTSTCSKEVLKVKAKVTLSTKLSGGGKEGEEITVSEGSKVKDTATLSGTNASSATGTVDYSVYKDKECKELAAEAGKGKVEGTKAGGSEEKELEAGAVYYWQAKYLGDSLHEESTSSCSKEVLTVKAKTSISTTLSGEEAEELIEGSEITVLEGTGVRDKAVLSGTNISTATGTVKYSIYSDSECKELIMSAGEGIVEGTKAGSSGEEKLEEGTYYWQAEYIGDVLHQASKGACGLEILFVRIFEGPSWLSNGNRMLLGENYLPTADPDEGGLSFDIGESTVVCTSGTGVSTVFGSKANRVGKTTMAVTPTNCKVLGAATSCIVTGFDINEAPLPAGDALVLLAGELVWRGTSAQRVVAGALLSGNLSFGVKREVITTLKFEEGGLEGCPPNLRGGGGPKVVSITGTVFGELLKEEPVNSKSYNGLSPNEEVRPFVLNLSGSTTEVESWEWVGRSYQVLQVKAQAGTENATVDGFIHAETPGAGEEVATLVG